MAEKQHGGHRLVLLLSIVAGLASTAVGEAARVAGSERRLLQTTTVSLPPLVAVFTNTASTVGSFNATHLERNATVKAVTAGVSGNTPLALTDLASDYPNPHSTQTFRTIEVNDLSNELQGLQGLPGYQLLEQLSQDRAVQLYKFNNTIGGKCWDDGGGQSATTLRQADCTASIRQVFQVVPGPSLPGCCADRKAMQVRSLSSLLLTSEVQGNLAGTCLTDGVTAPAFYACAFDPDLVKVQLFVITFDPFA